jgi:GTP pyrophosphokinase
MEVQLRTREMHQNAELGIAAHWKYKGRGGHAKDDAKFAWLRQLIERQGELEDPHEFLEVVKVDLFPDEVFVFTPKGDVVNLPKGATALDFAYAIHSQVGEHCAGARVNGTMRPLSHKLADGDTVEIHTSPSQAPKKDWLDFAVSGKARSRIRHAIREAENARSRELGRGLLERELRRASLSLARVLESDGLAEPARKWARGNVDDLYAALAYGKVAARDVVRLLRPDWQQADAAAAASAEKTGRLRSIFKREKRSSASGIRVDGHGDVMVRFGRCCVPLPGDEIVGFVTRGRGITVHARDCRVAFSMDPERQIEVEWDTGSDVARKVRVRVTSRDEPGLLAKITKTISSAGVNIGAARILTHADRTATQSFDLWVNDARTLAAVMREIGRIKGVHRVERVRA